MWQSTGARGSFFEGCYFRKMANFCLVNETVGTVVMDNCAAWFIIITWHLHRSLYFQNVLQPFFLVPSILPWKVNSFFSSHFTNEHKDARWTQNKSEANLRSSCFGRRKPLHFAPQGTLNLSIGNSQREFSCQTCSQPQPAPLLGTFLVQEVQL